MIGCALTTIFTPNFLNWVVSTYMGSHFDHDYMDPILFQLTLWCQFPTWGHDSWWAWKLPVEECWMKPHLQCHSYSVNYQPKEWNVQRADCMYSMEPVGPFFLSVQLLSHCYDHWTFNHWSVEYKEKKKSLWLLKPGAKLMRLIFVWCFLVKIHFHLSCLQ